MWRESFSYIFGTGNPGKICYNSRKEIFYISGNENPKKHPIFYKVTFRAQYKKLLKILLYFGKWNFLATNLKTFCFLEEPLRVFHHCFSGVFIFYHWFLLLFFGYFHCWLNFLMSRSLMPFFQVLHICVVILPLLRIWQAFFVFYLTLLSQICRSTACATILRELFLLSGIFYLTLLSNNLIPNNLAQSNFINAWWYNTKHE